MSARIALFVQATDLVEQLSGDRVPGDHAELPEIRSRRLAFNRKVTFKDAFAVATPLLASAVSPIAAISAAVDPEEADRLNDVGKSPGRQSPFSAPSTGSTRPPDPAAPSRRIAKGPPGGMAGLFA
ncbi:hypothetical protein ABZ729_19495 [Streptomyces sp. NPDC006678]|uniref:hypothetical protein n=1 Tax=Streptomyces sp. NPDC006678 TaxID=3157185 RepID=UPI003407AB0C